MFKGERGTGEMTAQGPSNWDPMKGQFKEVRSTRDFVTGKDFQFYDYGSLTALEQKTDLTVAGALQDCNECHVGGGAMEYLPAGGAQFTSALLALQSRTPLRNIATAADGTVNGGDKITPAHFTTFNYFLDSYDVNKNGNKAEMLYNDYAKTGVGEVDCLMCHMEGYSWDERKKEIRKAKHDTARAVGAGIATTNDMLWPAGAQPADGYGTTVGIYDVDKVVDDGAGNLKLAAAFADNIKRTPPSSNCASCHFGSGFTIAEGGDSKVDVKKRGDHWTVNHNFDVHSAALECMDCHYNSTTAATAGSTGAMYSSVGKVDLVNNNTGEAGPDSLDDATGIKMDMTGPDAGTLGMCDPVDW
jgi:hypothetical protein